MPPVNRTPPPGGRSLPEPTAQPTPTTATASRTGRLGTWLSSCLPTRSKPAPAPERGPEHRPSLGDLLRPPPDGSPARAGMQASAMHGPLTFSRGKRIGLDGRAPDLTITPTLVALPEALGRTVKKAVQGATRTVTDRPKAHAALDTPLPLPSLMLPRVHLRRQGELRVDIDREWAGTDRKAWQPMRRAVQRLLRRFGDQPVTQVTPHAPSAGSLVSYRDGAMRWVGSAAAAVPLAVYNVLKPRDAAGAPSPPLTAPPVEMLSGVFSLSDEAGQVSDFRLHDGALYRFQPGDKDRPGEWHGLGPADALHRHANGRVYVQREDHLHELTATGLRVPTLSGVAGWRSVQMLPRSATEPHPRAVGIAPDGQAVLLHARRPPQTLPLPPDVVEIMPAGEALLARGNDGRLHALQRNERGTWTAAPQHPLTDAARSLPLAAGHAWQVQQLGHSPGADGVPRMHALMVSDQGHRATAVLDEGQWRAQFGADGLQVVSQRGLASTPVRPGSELRYDLDTVLAIAENGSLCRFDNEHQRFETLRDANGQPLRGLQKIVTATGGLHDGKTLLALAERDGRHEVIEIPLTGRIKKLPAKDTRSWGSGPTPWMQPEPLGLGTPITRLAPRSSEPDDDLIDLAADSQGRTVALTRGGELLRTERSSVGSQVPWPRESAPLAKPAMQTTLPPVQVNGQTLSLRGLTLSGDRGRLLALAQAGDGPLQLVEHRPGRDSAEGQWHAVPLARPAGLTDAAWQSARLSTSLLGTPMVEIDAGDSAPQRFRLVQRGASPTAPDAPPPPHTLIDAALSGEDPRIAMDRNDAWRVKMPGTRAAVRQTWLGTGFNAINQRPAEAATATGKIPHYAAFPFRSLYEHAVDGVRLLQIPFMAAKRARQDLWGRQELRRDYAEVGQAMRSLRTLEPALSSQQALAVRSAAGGLLSAERSEVLADAHAVGSDALAHARKMLEEMCITSRVLQPDRVSEREPGWRRQLQHLAAAPLNHLTPGSRDALPAVRSFFDALARPEVMAALPEAEGEQIDHIRHLAGLLEKNGIRLWDGERGKLSNFTAYHGSHAITGAALARSMGLYQQAARTRAALQTTPEAELSNAAARDTLRAQAAQLKDDRSITLARCGFSGWAGLEAFYETVHDMRTQASASTGPLGVRSQLNRMMERDLDLPKPGTLPAEDAQALTAQKYSEAVASLNPRSTYFWLRSASAGLGLATGPGKESVLNQLAAKVLKGVSLGANTSLMGWRRVGMGVEALGSGDGTGQGPIIVFFVRANGANANVGASGNIPPVPMKVRDLSAFGVAGTGLDESRARGVAMVLPPEKLTQFSQMLFDPSVDPVELIKLGVNEGGVGLNLQERSATLLRATVGVGQRPPLMSTHPSAWGPNSDMSTSVNGGAGLALTAALEKRVMELRLRLSFLPKGGIGDEYQGAFGATTGLAAMANVPASLINARTTTQADALAANVTGARGNFDAAGAALNASWQPTYKRTVDFLRAEPVSQDSWDSFLQHLRQVPGLQLPLPAGVTPRDLGALDVASPAGRSTMRACLQTWTGHLQRMENAVVAPSGGTLAPHERGLLAQAQSTDAFLATRLMLNGRRLLQQSTAAERGVALLEPSARIEFNLPGDDPSAPDTTAHARLGPAMAKARQVEAEIDGMRQVKQANARLPGYNQARVVLNMHPRVVDLFNDMIAFGLSRQACERAGIAWPKDLPPGTDRLHLSYEDVRQMALRNPQNYGEVTLCAKNNEANVKTTSWGIGVPLAHSTIIAEERFLTEAAVRETGWGGRLLGAEVLPSGQNALGRPGKEQRSLARMGFSLAAPAGQQPTRTLPLRPLEDVLAPAEQLGLAPPELSPARVGVAWAAGSSHQDTPPGPPVGPFLATSGLQSGRDAPAPLQPQRRHTIPEIEEEAGPGAGPTPDDFRTRLDQARQRRGKEPEIGPA